MAERKRKSVEGHRLDRPSKSSKLEENTNSVSKAPNEKNGRKDQSHSGQEDSGQSKFKQISTNASTSADEKSTKRKTFIVTERKGDLFAAPKNTLLVQSCNARGHWGKGIALEFKKRYPDAFEANKTFCQSQSQESLPPSALLIPPSFEDTSSNNLHHFVGCLYVSRSLGTSKDGPRKILANTGPAMTQLLEQVKTWNNEHGKGKRIGKIHMCKINSGLFRVKWEDTKEILENIEVGSLDTDELVVMVRE